MAIDRQRMSGGYLPLRDAIDRLFEGSFITPQLLPGQASFPSSNLHVTEDEVVLESAVPGASPENIDISVTGNTVTVSGEIKREQRTQRGQAYVEELFRGQFQRSFRLPVEVDADKADATFENGVLKLTLPKAESVKPRKIQVGGQRGGKAQTRGDAQQETVPVGGQTS